MDLQPARQLDYLQRTLSIFLAKSSDMTEQLEALIDELIKESKQTNKSMKHSPESSSSDSKSDTITRSNSPQPLPQKKRSAPLAANSKPPPNKRLKSLTSTKDDSEEATINNTKTLKIEAEESSKSDEKDDIYDDEDDNRTNKSKPLDSQANSSSSRGIDEFAYELGLVCVKCLVLTEDKDNRLVECHECHDQYHQKCHKPPVSTADVSDPRFLWYCSKCRRCITKRQTQSSAKETKSNSNPTPSCNKPKVTESSLSTSKKGISTSIADVTGGFFSFKQKQPSDSNTSDTNSSHHPISSTSNSSLTNGSNTNKNTNGWASLATGFKEKKSNAETSIASTLSTTNNASSVTITTESNTLSTANNSNGSSIEGKNSPPSPKSSGTMSTNPFFKQLNNGTNLGLLKTCSATLIPVKPSKTTTTPPLIKPQLSASPLKTSQQILTTSKNMQRISSPMPIGRPTSIVKSPSSAITPGYQRLNSSGSNSSGSNSPSSAVGTNIRIATGQDYDKRLKQMKKFAAEKSLTKKS